MGGGPFFHKGQSPYFWCFGHLMACTFSTTMVAQIKKTWRDLLNIQPESKKLACWEDPPNVQCASDLQNSCCFALLFVEGLNKFPSSLIFYCPNDFPTALLHLYLYKIESLNFGRRDLGNGKSYHDMQYTGGFSMMCRVSETYSNVNQVIRTPFPESQRNVVFTGMISLH